MWPDVIHCYMCVVWLDVIHCYTCVVWLDVIHCDPCVVWLNVINCDPCVVWLDVIHCYTCVVWLDVINCDPCVVWLNVIHCDPCVVAKCQSLWCVVRCQLLWHMARCQSLWRSSCGWVPTAVTCVLRRVHRSHCDMLLSVVTGNCGGVPVPGEWCNWWRACRDDQIVSPISLSWSSLAPTVPMIVLLNHCMIATAFLVCNCTFLCLPVMYALLYNALCVSRSLHAHSVCRIRALFR